jgi:hypothetical protein
MQPNDGRQTASQVSPRGSNEAAKQERAAQIRGAARYRTVAGRGGAGGGEDRREHDVRSFSYSERGTQCWLVFAE